MNNQIIFQTLCHIIKSYLSTFCPFINCDVASKRQAVKDFQNYICDELNRRTSSKKWIREYKHPHRIENDKVDIYNFINEYHWIIEIDASRADQVAKKAFSRFALYGTGKSKTSFFYVAIIYPGTKFMSVNEVIKFSTYGDDIAKKMDKNNNFRTIMIDCNNSKLDIYPKYND